MILAKTLKNWRNILPSWLALALAGSLTTAATAQSGTGLTGQYFDTNAFGTLLTTRTDATVDFAWGTAIPSGTALTNADTFSVIWTGQIEAEFSEPYMFYMTVDDSATLWVNDQVVAHRGFFQSGGRSPARSNWRRAKR